MVPNRYINQLCIKLGIERGSRGREKLCPTTKKGKRDSRFQNNACFGSFFKANEALNVNALHCKSIWVPN